MARTAQVRVREVGKIQPFDAQGLNVHPGDYVIIEADRGIDYGQVTGESGAADPAASAKKIVRVANKEDLAQIQRNKQKLKDIREMCIKKIAKWNLPMKLVGAEYSFDRSKLIFYFTAEGRVDFRELVKELAAHFKARIELKQIGVRDEAKFMGGFGPCGRPLCCAKFLKDFEPVTVRMAKDQHLPLNPSKISGICGRLMCCLSYECQTYKNLSKGLPREGSKVKTNEGPGKAVSVNVLTRTVVAELDDGRQIEISY